MNHCGNVESVRRECFFVSLPLASHLGSSVNLSKLALSRAPERRRVA